MQVCPHPPPGGPLTLQDRPVNLQAEGWCPRGVDKPLQFTCSRTAGGGHSCLEPEGAARLKAVGVDHLWRLRSWQRGPQAFSLSPRNPWAAVGLQGEARLSRGWTCSFNPRGDGRGGGVHSASLCTRTRADTHTHPPPHTHPSPRSPAQAAGSALVSPRATVRGG